MKRSVVLAAASLVLAVLACGAFFRPAPCNTPSPAVRPSSSSPRGMAVAVAAPPPGMSERSVAPEAAVPAESVEPVAPDVFAAFENWACDYEISKRSGKQATEMEARGVALARRRREAMKQLIREDPREALAQALPWVLRQGLPAAVAEQLEKRVEGRGLMEVLVVDATEAPEVRRWVLLGGERYRAYVYGRRQAQPTLKDAPLNGIALDSEMAVSESPLRSLDLGETAHAGEGGTS